MHTYVEGLIATTREAGAEIMKLYELGDFETKHDGSPVTLADTRSHEALVRHLAQTNIPILSEESDGIGHPYPEQLWVIDPLDGTKDFLKKTKDFSVMVGLLEKGRPVLGVVYAPAFDVHYYAEKGGGAYKIENGITTKLTVTTGSEQYLRFLCSVNNFAPYMEMVAEKLSATKTPRGSIGVKAGLIAEDLGDFFFSQGALGEWDVCAPEIILCEAGGTVTDCEGNPLLYGNPEHRLKQGIVFSNGACHAQVLEAIQTSRERSAGAK